MAAWRELLKNSDTTIYVNNWNKSKRYLAILLDNENDKDKFLARLNLWLDYANKKYQQPKYEITNYKIDETNNTLHISGTAAYLLARLARDLHQYIPEAVVETEITSSPEEPEAIEKTVDESPSHNTYNLGPSFNEIIKQLRKLRKAAKHNDSTSKELEKKMQSQNRNIEVLEAICQELEDENKALKTNVQELESKLSKKERKLNRHRRRSSQAFEFFSRIKEFIPDDHDDSTDDEPLSDAETTSSQASTTHDSRPSSPSKS